MNETRVIWGQNPNDAFGEKLEETVAKIRNRMARKDQKAAECKMTREELLSLLAGPESFKGKVADLDKVARFERMKKLALWLDCHCYEVASVNVEDPSPSHPNVIISIDFYRMTALKGENLVIFNALCSLADDMFLAGQKEKTVRFTFGLLRVWLH